MRIKEINLQHYGPLPKFIKNFNEGVHVIYGLNESGKTLLIDAVMKLLIGGDKFSSELNRVEGTPSGYILLDKDGEEKRLDSKYSLQDIIEISSDELRNIFCIRDSDLHIDEETKFYERTQDKLVGLRSADIRRIIGELETRGRLTSSGALSDSAGNDKAKSILSETNSLIEEINSYLEETREKNVEELELELMRKKKEQHASQERLEILDKAKKRHEFNSIKENYDALVEANIESQKIQTNVISDLQTKISSFETENINEQGLHRKLGQFKSGFQISFILTAITVGAVYLLSAPIIGYIVPALFFGAGLYFINQWNESNNSLSNYEQLKNSVIDTSKLLNFASNTIPEIKAELTTLQSNNDAIQTNLLEKRGIVKNAFDLETNDTDEVITQAKDRLTTLEDELDLEVSEPFSETEYITVQESIEQIQEQINEITEQLETHRTTLEDYQKRISKLNYNTFMGSELDLEIVNLEALDSIIPFLEKLSETIKLDRVTANEAINIFKEMETEEERRITELFSTDSLAVTIFMETTGGRYKDVRYDVDSGKVIVEKSSGEILEESKLSKGTRDQLYLAIRVALGEKLLEGSTGFFIMDDAFLTSDEDRLQTQVELLEDLSKKGWQIIYITMKKEAKDYISAVTENELLTLNTLS